jgi:ATP-dependent DNA helicase RecG
LLEEVHEVFTQIQANNNVRHVRRGVSTGQLRDLPDLAIREAVINGLAHREWALSEATVVEHVGRTLRVTSPGGFVGGITPQNIITHPSQSRNKSLTELFARVRIAEREGIGVDRMVREMVRVGHRPPEIQQIDGPYVRTSLVGDVADSAWIEWLGGMAPDDVAEDLNALLLLRLLVNQGWIDAATAAPELQLNESETQGALNRLAQSTTDENQVIGAVVGVPDGESAAWTLTEHAREKLRALDTQAGTTRAWPSRQQIARSYARSRGRISTTELGSIVAASPTNVGGVLKGLMQAGELNPSRPQMRGPGFFYVWDGSGVAAALEKE